LVGKDPGQGLPTSNSSIQGGNHRGLRPVMPRRLRLCLDLSRHLTIDLSSEFLYGQRWRGLWVIGKVAAPAKAARLSIENGPPPQNMSVSLEVCEWPQAPRVLS